MMGSAGGTCLRDGFHDSWRDGEDGEARWRDSQMQRSPFEEDGSEGVVTADEGQSPRAGLAHEV